MSKIELTWDLKSQSEIRCLCVYTNQFHSSELYVGDDYRIIGHLSSSPSPSEDTSTKFTHNAPDTFDITKKFITTPDINCNQGIVVNNVVFGTECGDLHFRSFLTDTSLSFHRGTSFSKIQPHLLFMKSKKKGFGFEGSSSEVMPHKTNPSYPSRFFNKEIWGPENNDSELVDCIPAYPTFLPSSSHVTSCLDPLFLVLKSDNSTNLGSNITGFYSSYLVYLTFNNYISRKSVNTEERHIFTYNEEPPSNGTFMLFPRKREMINSFKSLPKMSCVAYHPLAGYVYAAGSNVQSLSPSLVHSISMYLFDSGNFGKETTRGDHKFQWPNVYFDALNALPSPGARPGRDSMILTCDGKVCIVAACNAFYAVGGLILPPHWFLLLEDENDYSYEIDSWSKLLIRNSREAERNNLMCYKEGCLVKKISDIYSLTDEHPAIIVDIPLPHELYDEEDDLSSISTLFLASGHVCSTVEIFYNMKDGQLVISSDTRPRTCRKNGSKRNITTFATPILSAVSLSSSSKWKNSSINNDSMDNSGNLWDYSLVVILTSDGFIHTRSPFCVGVPISTIEVGLCPNDFFILRSLPGRRAVATSYSGKCQLLTFQYDTAQDLADRLMKFSIDAFGKNGFPRSDLADAVGASFSMTNYVGTEPTEKSRNLLLQYLEVILGFHVNGNVDSETSNCYSHCHDYDETCADDNHNGAFANFSFHFPTALKALSSVEPAVYLSGTALLCLVCMKLSPDLMSFASSASKLCARKFGVSVLTNQSSVRVCEVITESLLSNQLVTSTITFTSRIQTMETVVWLLRSCGRHERAIDVLVDIMNDYDIRDRNFLGNDQELTNADRSLYNKGGLIWSHQFHIATYLKELWESKDESARSTVLCSVAMRNLLESNPYIGLRILIASHPQNDTQWEEMNPADDPLSNLVQTAEVIEFLKSISPITPYHSTSLKGIITTCSPVKIMENDLMNIEKVNLHLSSGRALCVTFLESVIGISTGRFSSFTPQKEVDNTLLVDRDREERIMDIHDELAYLLLGELLLERGPEDDNHQYVVNKNNSVSQTLSSNKIYSDSNLGKVYRFKLRRLLTWPHAKIRAKRLLSSIPDFFLRERALLLGRLGCHDDALRILYCKLQSLDLALEYCDAHYESTRRHFDWETKTKKLGRYFLRKPPCLHKEEKNNLCAYLALVSIALKSDSTQTGGMNTAIRILSLRQNVIDHSAALRLLPKTTLLSAIARPFIIPSLIDGESNIRHLEVVSALLRSRLMKLKKALTEVQVKSQSNLHDVLARQSLHLGEPNFSSKPFKPRLSHHCTPNLPDITVIKHFFSNHLVIEAKVTNSLLGSKGQVGRCIGDIDFIVAESSDDSLIPSFSVPLDLLPVGMSGSIWYILSACPRRLDVMVTLACELRYKVLTVDAITGGPLDFGGIFEVPSGSGKQGRAIVEGLQDIEVYSNEFDCCFSDCKDQDKTHT